MDILLVDDDSDCLENMVRALQPTGYSCVPVNDSLTALNLYREHHFDVVVSDIKMPGMTGLELLEQIKEIDRDARVIIVTAFGDLKTAVNAINLQAYSFFGKPIDLKELIHTIRKVEQERREDPNHTDFEKLRKEHLRLKSAYNNLLGLIQDFEEFSGENGKNNENE